MSKMSTRRVVLLCCVALTGVGCSQKKTNDAEPPAAEVPEETAAPADALTGTQWQLVEIQSMSDEVGTERPDDPTLYTLSFGNDGKASLRLNCNRGTGTWSATASSSTGGSLEFGPLAVTRALCPPPSLDERIARDLGFVRSYTRDGARLYLSLQADGGIYVWEPLAADPEQE